MLPTLLPLTTKQSLENFWNLLALLNTTSSFLNCIYQKTQSIGKGGPEVYFYLPLFVKIS